MSRLGQAFKAFWYVLRNKPFTYYSYRTFDGDQ